MDDQKKKKKYYDPFAAEVEADSAEFQKIPYRTSYIRLILFWLGVICSGGILGLILLWFPRFWLPIAYTRLPAISRDVSAFLIRRRTGKKFTSVYVQKDGTKRWFEYQCLRYIYDESANDFFLVEFFKDFTLSAVHSPEVSQGLTTEEANKRLNLIGDNVLRVPIDSIFVALPLELLQPFYIYTFLACALWFYDNYQYYAGVLMLMTLISAVSSVLFTRRNQKNIQKMVAKESMVRVLRDGQWTEMLSGGLVPGDVIALDDNQTVPADLLLFAGEAVVDESMLTGESIPVRKFPVLAGAGGSDSGGAYRPSSVHKKHTLWCGTVVLKKPPEAHGGARALVVATAYGTLKGGLIRKILFPNPVKFKYDRQVVWLLIGLACMSAASFGVSIHFWGGVEATGGVWRAVVYGLEIVSIIIPVILPFVLNTGAVAAAVHLRRFGIYCISPPRIVMAGKIRVFCFDKTGTLTKDGLDVIGLHTVATPVGGPQKPVFDDAVSTTVGELAQRAPRLVDIAATCHSATVLNGVITGHPVDVAMFQWTGFRLVDNGADTAAGTSTVEPPALGHPANSGPARLKVLRTFEFDHNLARMSVVVTLDPASADGVSTYVFSKGSPESIASVCRPETVPVGFAEKVSEISKKGGYVLGMAYRPAPEFGSGSGEELRRGDAERELVFGGLIVFQNQLREDTADVLETLRHGDVRSVIVTGDIGLTAISIAREAKLILPHKRVYYADVVDTASGAAADHHPSVVWTDFDTGKPVEITPEMLAANDRLWKHQRIRLQRAADFHPKRFSDTSFSEIVLNDRGTDSATRSDTSLLSANSGSGNDIPEFELAVSGAALRVLMSTPGLLDPLLFHIRIFSRVTPDQKAQVVRAFIARNVVVGMVGDGANDTGALRAAHAGIALSQAEASVVSPFTSKHKSVACVIALLAEGRSLLSTSFRAVLALLITYGVLQHFGVLTAYYYGGDFSEGMYIMQDLIIVFPLSTFLVRPNPRIGKNLFSSTLLPRRPTASLTSASTLSSVIGQAVIGAVYISAGAVMVAQQSWFEEEVEKLADLDEYWFNPWSATTWYLSTFLMVSTYWVYSLGTDFTRRIWYNWTIVILLVFYFAVLSWWVLSPPDFVTDLMEVFPFEKSYRLKVYFLCLGAMATQVLYEFVLVLGPVSSLIRRKFDRRQLELGL